MAAYALAQPVRGAKGKSKLGQAVRSGILLMATVFTNAGASIVTNKLRATGTAPLNIAWGTGVATAVITQTALTTEAATSGGAAGGASTRTVGTASSTQTTVPGDTYTVVGTVTAAGTLAIVEAGLFDAAQAGNMLIRADFPAINVASGDSIAFTFNLKFIPQ